jgi:hypothetical protein
MQPQDRQGQGKTSLGVVLRPRRLGRMNRRRRRLRRGPSCRNGRAGSVCNDFTGRDVAANVASPGWKSDLFEHLILFHVPTECTVAAKAALGPRSRQLTEDRSAPLCENKRAARVSEHLTLRPTSVERLRHLKSLTALAGFSLLTQSACWLKHLEIHRVSPRSNTLALHLHTRAAGKKEEMLKITITNTATVERWTLQGRLVAPWVNELKTTWRRARRVVRKRSCIVNLDEVTFIDSTGERVLRSMSKQGARLVASDVYVKHLLDRLCGKSR